MVAPAVAAVRQPSYATRMRVLLIEDDPALGSAVRDYLAREGHAVDWVERAGAARACLPPRCS